ncbi:hypothetical protein UREG_06039 [Uncinocarpus reesii 1704]|uniref:DNA mismatch repair proteins mutS family domain-containing protein n=1 Tax=Uncinocarpus reesii (strain UAMH 1704) TaxID=336963 RepID=C4JUA0_UNCRE|nr:uncharacterized protein UREG_06039 [Uncinocarpus reesii 1704]EEP81197.1 hypothetical protein UREG_06039 [Uncinocarpus reesii 1704]
MPSTVLSSRTCSGWSSNKRSTTAYTTPSGRPRTGRPTTTATSISSQDIICAISESRGICPTVGLAFVNIATSEAILCQICDSQTYARTIQKLAVLEPTEILFMKTAKEPRSKLYSIVEENLPQLAVTTIDRRYWAEKSGHEYVDQLAFKDDLESIKISLEGNYFAACCLAAALSYIEFEMSKTFATHSLRIKYEPSDGSMMVDLATIISLELIQNLQNTKSKDCLFGVLNETLTPMGARLLRSNILQPSTEKSKLLGRYDAVEELGTSEDMFHAVREDVARQSYKEANNDVNELASHLAEAHNLALDLRFEAARQYYFRLPVSDLEDRQLPDIFINIFQKKAYVEFQTLELVKLNQKITDSHNEVINMSDRSIQELIEVIRPEISVLFRISEGLAMLDMLATFAQLVAVRDYIRPEITDTLAIKSGRHPIREKIHHSKFVPNDAYATRQSRFQIITGCNMSGKSTYIRSLALMTVMAQIGCFVPAQYASFPIVNQLFARVSADDSAEANVSTFSAEMREMAFILRNIGPRSMVIVDELGRGTSTVDGLSIAIAISEALVDSHALVWFATHFHELARILAHRNGVVNLHLAVEMSNPTSTMTMLYKIADGYAQDKHYGLAFARFLSFPPELLETAQTVSQKLNLKSADQRRSLKQIAIAKRRQLLLALREQLFQARDGMMKGDELRTWLKKLQDEFTMRMADLETEMVMATDGENTRRGRATD